ncbi:hypothetical protein PO909_014524 [Leuciscus waleckii]
MVEHTSTTPSLGSRQSAHQSDSELRLSSGALDSDRSGVTMGAISRRKVISTDASNLGWRALFEGRPVFGQWSDREKRLHINCLEMMAVENALRHFLPHLQGHDVLVRSPLSSRRLDLASSSRALVSACMDNQRIPVGLPEGVVNTITQSRAPSTRRLYASKWSVFASWCSAKGSDPQTCGVAEDAGQLAVWSSHYNLELITLKTVEMIVDFRRRPGKWITRLRLQPLIALLHLGLSTPPGLFPPSAPPDSIVLAASPGSLVPPFLAPPWSDVVLPAPWTFGSIWLRRPSGSNTALSPNCSTLGFTSIGFISVHRPLSVNSQASTMAPPSLYAPVGQCPGCALAPHLSVPGSSHHRRHPDLSLCYFPRFPALHLLLSSSTVPTLPPQPHCYGVMMCLPGVGTNVM